METVSGHTRLYRRNATYYHRAKVSIDILSSCGKSEETFSLKAKDYKAARRLIKLAAVVVDKKFETHRRSLNRPTYDTLFR